MKKIFLLLMLASSNIFAMDTPMLGFTQANASQSATNYHIINNTDGSASTAWSATEKDMSVTIPIVSTFKNFNMTISAAPGAAKSYTFTIRKNQAATSITCQISGAASTTCSDLTHTFTTVAGDVITLQSVPAGTPAVMTSRWNMIVTANANQSLVAGGTPSNSTNNSTNYTGPQSDGIWSATETARAQMNSPPGVLKNFYVNLATTTGAAKSYAFTLMKNGVAQTLTCTVTNATTCSDTTHTVSVSAGDLLSIRNAPTSTPAATKISYGMEFTPTTDGESPVMLGGNNSPLGSDTTPFYVQISGFIEPNTTENNRKSAMVAAVIKNLYAQQGTAPGTANTFTYTFRNNGSSSTLTCTNSNAATTCSDTTHTVSVALNDLSDTLIQGTLTFASPGQIYTGYTIYIAPPVSYLATINGTADIKSASII